MILISIDPSIVDIGWAAFDLDLKDPDRALLGYGHIKVLGSKEGKGEDAVNNQVSERLADISRKLSKIPFQPDIVVVEKAPKIAYKRHTSQRGKNLIGEPLIKLHYATGATLLHYGMMGIRTELVEVLAWKGRQSKEDTGKLVEYIYKIKVNEHVCDGIMIGNYYMRNLKAQELYVQYRNGTVV